MQVGLVAELIKKFAINDYIKSRAIIEEIIAAD